MIDSDGRIKGSSARLVDLLAFEKFSERNKYFFVIVVWDAIKKVSTHRLNLIEAHKIFYIIWLVRFEEKLKFCFLLEWLIRVMFDKYCENVFFLCMQVFFCLADARKWNSIKTTFKKQRAIVLLCYLWILYELT